MIKKKTGPFEPRKRADRSIGGRPGGDVIPEVEPSRGDPPDLPPDPKPEPRPPQDGLDPERDRDSDDDRDRDRDSDADQDPGRDTPTPPSNRWR